MNEEEIIFETIPRYPLTTEDYFKHQVPSYLVDDFVKLFRNLFNSKEEAAIEDVKTILEKRKTYNKPFKNKKKDIQIYCYQQEIKKTFFDKIDEFEKELILLFICFDQNEKKFNIFIPKKMKLEYNMDVFSISSIIMDIKNNIKNAYPFIIYEDKDKYSKDLKFEKKSIENLLKYINDIESIKSMDYIESTKYEDTQKYYTDPIELFNYTIENFSCLKALENVIKVII